MFGRAVDLHLDHHLANAVTAARAMGRGGVGWYPRAGFMHLDTGPVRFWELDEENLRTILAGGRFASGRTVAQRMAIHRALARREFLMRRR